MSLSQDFVSELRKHFTGEIGLDKRSRILYSTDASIYQIEPLGVALPRTQDDLAAVVELAAKYKVPVLPRGSGSSLAGQAIGQALILDCSRYLDKIIEISEETHTAKVEPGVILASLNRAAARKGLMFGPDPASAERATMGGVIGNNATGAHSIIYGMTADNLLGADVILADGSIATWGEVDAWKNEELATQLSSRQKEIIETAFEIREKYSEAIRENWPNTWRNSAGYRLNYLLPWSETRPPMWRDNDYPPGGTSSAINLAALLAGSEGTLAVIRSATVNLVPKPKNTILSVLNYNSIVEACEAVPDLLLREPSAVELIPQMLVHLARSIPAYSNQLGFVRGDPAALLVVEFSGNDLVVLREKAKFLRDDALIAESASDQAMVWAVRKVGLGIFDSHPAETRPVAFIEDCAIPVEHLGEFVRETERILAAYGTEAAFYAHASAGCLHIRPILNLKSGEGVRNMRLIAHEVLALTLQLGGAMSSEHGDGLLRAEWLKQTYGEQVIEAMRALKQAADPDSLFNPRKLTSAPPMDTNLRYGTEHRSNAWVPALDFGRNGGLETAIEQCNGQGVCRKLEGVMCPSFQATRNEMHSTRGRANLLRWMISAGRCGLPAEQVKQALDLCLACKGCKAECPSGVDMAKLKYEFQSHYYENHPRPAGDYLFSYIGILARLGAPFGRLINLAAGSVFGRKLFRWVFGVSENRSIPKFVVSGHKKVKREISRSKIQDARKSESCLFLPDTFTHFFESVVEEDALEVLSFCGMDVKIIPVFGAGRTLLSKGFIGPAKQHGSHLLDEIRRADPTGTLAVVGLEPSEIYTLRDELLDLLPERRAEIESLASRAWLLDEYLVRPSVKTGKLRIANIVDLIDKQMKQKTLLHGHCYQKAQPLSADGFACGVNASAELLRAAGCDVDIIDSGCCGMAGAFGYESQHYDVSMRIGELKLFPTLRRKVADENSKVIAIGTSCRSQIVDGTGLQARHSIVMVAEILKSQKLI